MRRARTAALIVATCLVLASCGSRVVPLSSGGGIAGSGISGDSGQGATVPIAQSSLPAGTSGNGNASGDPIVLPGTGGNGNGGGAPLPGLANCHGGASDVGVTATTVKLGLVASLTGPLPGQFNSEVEAVDAYVRLLNDNGGICGRKFQLIIRDDNGDGKTDLAVATKLATEDKVFAFLGSASAPDDSGIAAVSKKYKIPDIGFPLSWARTESPYTYGVPGQIQRKLIGRGANGMPYLNKKFGVKQVALFWLRESEVSILEAWGFEAAIMAADPTIKICHEQPSGVLDNNYENYVVAMKGDCPTSKGPVGVFTTMENNANIKLAIAMKDQEFHPAVFGPTFTSYLPSFIEQAQGATEGAYMAMPQIPFERLAQPTSTWTPGTYELKRYIDTLNHYNPRHRPPGSFGAPGWGAAALFFQMTAQCGADLTRACILHSLDTTPPFSAGGFLSPTLPRTHQIYHADLLVQVQHGKYVEIRQDDKSGPSGAPDFWDNSELFDWWAFYCSHQDMWGKFTSGKSSLIRC